MPDKRVNGACTCVCIWQAIKALKNNKNDIVNAIMVSFVNSLFVVSVGWELSGVCLIRVFYCFSRDQP